MKQLMEIDIGETRQSTNNVTPQRAAEKKKDAKDALAKNFIKKGKSLRIHHYLRSTSTSGGAPSRAILDHPREMPVQEWRAILRISHQQI